MSYADLHEYGSESAVKAAGKLRQQGKPYESMSLSSLPHDLQLFLRTFSVVDGDIAYWKAGG
jgi:obg-like ATPase 1